jgi:hypothetical protein
MDETYDTTKTDIFGRSRLQQKTIGKIDEDWAIWYIILSVVTVIVATATLFTA